MDEYDQYLQYPAGYEGPPAYEGGTNNFNEGDTGYTDPYEQGYQGGYSAGDPTQAIMQADPDVWGYLTKGLNLTPAQIGNLIKGAGSVAALVMGIRNGNITADQIGQSVAQTAQYNKEAATQTSVLSNPNISGVYGSRTWSGPDAQGRYTATDKLSPEQQQLYDQTVGVAGQRNAATGQILGSRDWSQAPTPGAVPMADMSRMGAGLQTSLDFSSAGPIQRGLDFSAAGPIQRSVNIDQYGRPVTSVGPFGPIQNDLNYRGAPAMPVADKRVRDQVVQNFIMQEKPYFDQQWSERLRSVDTQLRNEGIVPGSAAYDQQMGAIRDDMGRAWNTLTSNAVVEGTNAMNVLFGEQMSSRQQGVGEINTQGQFHNTAQEQGANQSLSRAYLANAGQAQGVNQALAAGQFANTAQAQGAGQIAQAGQFANQAQQQGANQIYQQGTFANNAQNQGVQQYLAGTSLNQQGQGQGWNQTLGAYYAPIQAASSMQQGGQPTVPQFGPTTGATVGQATASPLLTNMAVGDVNAAKTGNVTNVLTRTLPNYLPG